MVLLSTSGPWTKTAGALALPLCMGQTDCAKQLSQSLLRRAQGQSLAFCGFSAIIGGAWVNIDDPSQAPVPLSAYDSAPDASWIRCARVVRHSRCHLQTRLGGVASAGASTSAGLAPVRRLCLSSFALYRQHSFLRWKWWHLCFR